MTARALFRYGYSVSDYQINKHCLNYITNDTQLCSDIITQHKMSHHSIVY